MLAFTRPLPPPFWGPTPGGEADAWVCQCGGGPSRKFWGNSRQFLGGVLGREYRERVAWLARMFKIRGVAAIQVRAEPREDRVSTDESITIRLSNASWEYFPQQPVAPPGGFGGVFRGKSAEGSTVAVKRLHISVSEAAHRELRIAAELAGRDYSHVMHFLDSGQDSENGHYFVVMPLAEYSLQGYLEDSEIEEAEAVLILREILTGLMEVPELVHRDLKPGNVLWHEGAWRIADFGIARFVEESTSLQTLRSCLTPPYAAPEQWLLEKPSSATDTYALGCIAYQLLCGTPPFRGDVNELRRQHLEDPPSPLQTERAQFASLVTMMLRKRPETRPSQERVKEVLDQLELTEHSPRPARLAEHGARLAAQAAKSEATERREAQRVQREEKILAHGLEVLRSIAQRLVDSIAEPLPTAKKAALKDSWHVDIPGRASLKVSIVHQGPGRAFGVGWYVLAGGTVGVTQRGTHRPYDWSANLWFARIGDTEEFRWYEVGYMNSPLLRSSNAMIPFSLGVTDAASADGGGMRPLQVAYRDPLPIDDEDEESFCNRWVQTLVDALDGKLQYPRHAPFDPRSLFESD